MPKENVNFKRKLIGIFEEKGGNEKGEEGYG